MPTQKKSKSRSKERTLKVEDLKTSERSEDPKAGTVKVIGNVKWGDVTLKRG